MKNNILIILTTLLVTWSLGLSFAQSDYKLQPFDAISVTGNIEVILQKGDAEKAVVEVFGIPEDELNIRVSGEELKLSILNSLFYKNEKIKVTVYYKNLRSIRGHAGAKISSTEVIETDKLIARATSGADVRLEIQVNALEGTANEGGILQLKGKTESQEAVANTGGQYRAFDLESQRTYARASTGGEVEVVALQSLDANANLGGEVEYKGNPDERNRRTVLGGGVRKVQ